MRESRLYIAVLDEVPANKVPLVIAHTMLGAHLHFEHLQQYEDYVVQSFRKCIVKVNRKEFKKISELPDVYLGHENTTLGGEKSCAIPLPVLNKDLPNVLKYAKLYTVE